MLETVLMKLSQRRDLAADEMQQAVEAVMSGSCSEAEIAALLTALRVKGESVEELVGAARALVRHATPIRSRRGDLLDTCGTGGDGSGTFNISTAAALVAAAAGVPVAKHGNRAQTSKSGSADVLRALGVNVEAPPAVVERCLDELGFAFCYAPLVHQAMRHAAPVRRQLPFRTLFNLIGPLSNPAGAAYQLVGVARRELLEPMARALGMLGRKKAWVVCAANGLDEVSVSGTTYVCEVRSDRLQGVPTNYRELEPEDFGLARSSVAELRVETAEQSAAVIREVFAGRAGAARNAVTANAGAALVVAERTSDFKQAASTAAEAIDSGAAAQLLDRLIGLTTDER